MVTLHRNLKANMTMPLFVAMCETTHGGEDTALYAIKEAGGIKHVVMARRAFKELTDELLWLRKQIKRLEAGTPSYYRYRTDIQEVEDAMDFIRFKFPDA